MLLNDIPTDINHILTNLGEFGYHITGIKYLFISCSSHTCIKSSLRGINIAMDNSQLEECSKGKNVKLDVFAYYNNKCYQLFF